jgi:hypothetical protein
VADVFGLGVSERSIAAAGLAVCAATVAVCAATLGDLEVFAAAGVTGAAATGATCFAVSRRAFTGIEVAGETVGVAGFADFATSGAALAASRDVSCAGMGASFAARRAALGAFTPTVAVLDVVAISGGLVGFAALATGARVIAGA